MVINARLIPEKGAKILINPEKDLFLSSDERTWMCRILYDPTLNKWLIASHFNSETGRWKSVTSHQKIGMIIFLNDEPLPTDTHVQISSIKRGGTAAYGDLICE